MARAPRKPAAANSVVQQIVAPMIDVTPETMPATAMAGAETATAMIDAAVEATLAAPAALHTTEAELIEAAPIEAQAAVESAARAIDATADATLAAAAALPTVEAAPISVSTADVVATIAQPVVAAGTATPAKAADAFADNVTALWESGAALAKGFERFHARLADVAYANMREGLALQQAMLGLGTTDALARRGPAWVGERIGAFAAVPGELAMIAFETAEAAAKPVVTRAKARFAGGAAGSIV